MKKPLKVLIVEDERLIAKCLKRNIEDLGVIVPEPPARGEDSIDIALSENPDLILMDIRLAGGMDGIEATEQILIKKKIPIVFMTGFAIEDIKERAQELNPVAYLEKPVDINSVKKIIGELKAD